MKRKLAAFIICGCTAASLALSGCGSKNIDSEAVVATLIYGLPSASAETEAEVTSDAETEAENTSDVEAEDEITEADFTSDELATYERDEVSLGLANFMARYQQAQYDTNYISWFGSDMWSQDLYGTGNTFEDDVKDGIMDNLETYLLLYHHMSDYGVEFTEDDETAVDETAAQFMADNTDEAISQLGATEEYVAQMLKFYTVADRMYDAIIATADTEVSDEEAAQRTFSYVQVERNTSDDSEESEDEDTESDDTSDTESVKTDEEIYVEVSAFQIEAEEDMESAATDFGYTVSTESYGSLDDTDLYLDTEVYEAAEKIKKEGKVSDVIETDNYYYVIRLDSNFDEEATETKKESIISERQSEMYTSVLEGYEAEVTWIVDDELWAQVSFDNFFTTDPGEEETEGDTSDTETEGETSDAYDNSTEAE